MPDNSQHSPSRPAPTPAMPASAADGERPGRGPLLMVPMGLVLGPVSGAFAGASGAALLGLIYAGHDRLAVDFVAFGSVFGFVLGGCAGVLLGVILGAIAGVCRARMRQRLIRTATRSAALIGGTVGMLGGRMVGNSNPSLAGSGGQLAAIAWLAIGGAIGAAAGFCGGWLLGTLLANLCWGRVDRWAAFK
ncbi:MAG: hypothetical protein K8T25_02225 [Planctomycetia bacterium]|nr:hypothetical protein [Planctomycetia bacterium]